MSTPITLRRFLLVRNDDVHGVSGTGIVAEGVQFSSGSVALQWLGELSSIVYWKNIEDAMKVHGHDGRTFITWVD